MTQRIRVTQRHIRDGIRNNAAFDPVARALYGKRIIFNKREDNYIWVTYDFLDKYELFKTPQKVIEFLKRFDAGKKVKCFSFTLTDKGVL